MSQKNDYHKLLQPESAPSRAGFANEEIIERVEIEEKVRQSEERLRLATEAAEMFSWETDFKTGKIEWSENAAQLIGCSAETLSEQISNALFFVAEEDAARLEKEFKQFLANREATFVFQFCSRNETGETKFWQARGLIIYDDAAQAPVRVVGVTQNITARKRREANLGFLAEVAEGFAQLSDADEIIKTVGAKIGDFLGVANCLFAEVDEKQDRVNAEYEWRRADTPIPALVGIYRLSEFVTEEFQLSARTGETIVVRDTQNDRRTDAAAYAAFHIRSFVTVLFHRTGEWKYLFAVNDSVARNWRADEIELIREITNRIFPRLERARAETALKKSEAHLAAVFAQAEVGLSEVALDGRFLRVNDELCRILGRTREETLQTTFADVTFPADFPASQEGVKKVLETGETVSFDKRYLRPNGEVIWGNVTISLLENAAGEEPTFLAVTADLTERKRFEQQIAGQNRTLEALAVGKELKEILDLTVRTIETVLTNSRASVLLADETGERLFCGSADSLPEEYNRAIEGITIGEGVGSCGTAAYRRQPVAVADIGSDPLWANYREIALRHNLAACWSHPILAPDGKLLGTIAIYFSSPRPPAPEELEMLESAARVAGIAVYRKQTEERLRESESNLRRLADSIPQLAWMAEPDGYIFWYNRRWYEYTGTTPEQMQGWGWQTVHDKRLLPQVVTRWRHSIETGEPFEMEFPLKSASGEFRWFLTRVNPLRDSSGKITRWFGTNTDVDESRRARKQAEEANLAKDEFLAVLSHELRTPLNAMYGWSQILEQSNFDPAVTKQAVEIITRNVRLQNALIEDLLDVSRIISGKMRLECEAVSLVSVVQTAIDAARPAAAKQNLRIEAELDPAADEVFGDKHRLEQIVGNLLTNAIKFSISGGEIRVRLKLEDARAKLTVQDAGIGIAPELLPHIFDRFRQADASSKRRFGGLGLGLTIVKHLVELHGGAISAYSGGEGKGAAFTIELPLAASRITRADLRVDAVENVACETKPLAGTEILVVDDDSDALELMSFVLKRQGANVAACNSAREALEKLKNARFDLLISDLGMAEMDGYDLIRAVRERENGNGSRLPAIALTGYVSADDRERVLNAGFQMHLSKPVNLDNLSTAALDLMGK